MQGAFNQVLLNMKGDGLLETSEIEFLQKAHEFLGQYDGDQQQDSAGQKRELPRQYDVVDNVAGNQGLGKTHERCGEDNKETEHAFLPISGGIGTEVLEVFLDAGTAIPSGDPVFREFSGETLFEICEPAIQ